MEKTFFGRNCLLGLLMVLASFFSLPVAAASPESLAFDELYAGVSSRGLVLSDKLVSLDGNTVTIQGFYGAAAEAYDQFFCADRGADVDLPILFNGCRLAGQYYCGKFIRTRSFPAV